MAAEIRQSAAQADVVVNQHVGLPSNDVALERGRSHQPIERQRACMPYAVVLDDLAKTDRQAELSAEDLSHSVRDRVESCRFQGGDRQERSRLPRKLFTKSVVVRTDLAAGAATIYQNYFAEVSDQSGQSRETQIDCLQESWLGKMRLTVK